MGRFTCQQELPAGPLVLFIQQDSSCICERREGLGSGRRALPIHKGTPTPPRPRPRQALRPEALSCTAESPGECGWWCSCLLFKTGYHKVFLPCLCNLLEIYNYFKIEREQQFPVPRKLTRKQDPGPAPRATLHNALPVPPAHQLRAPSARPWQGLATIFLDTNLNLGFCRFFRLYFHRIFRG